MRTRVVVPPAPIVLPSELGPGFLNTDARTKSLIAATTEEIDGPTGWVGLCFGPQTLEATLDCWERGPVNLICGPIIGIESVKYLDGSGVLQTVAPADYAFGSSLSFRSGWSAPSLGSFPDPIRIRYKAGYNGTEEAAAGDVQTGPMPERARWFVIVMAQDLAKMSDAALGLRSETVEGVGSQTFVDQDRISGLVRQRAERMLDGLRVWSV